MKNLDIEPPTGARYPTLLFADDTLLFSAKAAHMEHLLSLVIEHSTLTLNKGKCQLLVTHDVGSRVNFPDGTPVTRQEQIKYLGATFTTTLNINSIIRQKLTEASATMRTLQPLWTDNQISTPWKLVVYNAVVRSRVFYTLETLELTPGQQRTLDTLYFRGLRKILKKGSTFIDRYWTHERLLNLANQHQKRVAPNMIKHISFSNYYRIRRRKLLGHLLRAPPNNLTRLAILSPENIDRVDTRRKKRVGRPRYTWLYESLKDAWEQFLKNPSIRQSTSRYSWI